MVTVACVYKPGNGFTFDYVRRLRESLLEQPTLSNFLCVTTDRDAKEILGEEALLIPDVLPGWWNKMLLFSDIIEGERIVYFDLDTMIVGDISALLCYDDFPPLFLDDFYEPYQLATGIMSWRVGQLNHLHERFMKNPIGNISRHDRGSKSNRGDQAFIRANLELPWFPVQKVQQGVRSYKRDILKGIFSKPTIVAFHGRPRPHEVNWSLK